MTTVFIGGSRSLVRLNDVTKSRLDNIVRQNFTVLIGDANGIDKAVQNYLVSKEYKNVIVYCMGKHCRNNLGNWPTRNIRTDRQKKDFAYYSAKDQEMAEAALYGFMIWDGKSKGTLNNILNLARQNKKVLVYFSPDKSCYTVKSDADLIDLVRKCNGDAQQRFEKEFSISTQTMGQVILGFFPK